MKITLDISKLVEDGKLTPAEAERLKAFASHDTGSFGINILVAFGVIAVAAGAVALVPSPATWSNGACSARSASCSAR